MKTSCIDRDTTAALKGLALIFMFAHHFFTFPDWYIDGIAYPAIFPYVRFLQGPLKMCVVVFAFLTGYFYHFSTRKNLNYSLRKITDVLLSYWIVFIPLMGLALVLGTWKFTPAAFLKELLALERPIMLFCWYVYFYYVSMILLPLLDKMGTKSPVADAALMIAGPTMVFTILLGILEYEFGITSHFLVEICSNMREWFPCMAVGYLCSKYAFFENYLDPLTEKLFKGRGKYVLYLILCGVTFFSRLICPRFTLGAVIVAGNRMDLVFLMDVFYGPLFVYGAVNLLKAIPAAISRVLMALGKQSLLMWFLHCAFFGASKTFTQPILYFPKNPILVLIWGLSLCYGLAVLLDIPLKKLLKLKNTLFK